MGTVLWTPDGVYQHTMKHIDEDEEAEFEVRHRGDWSQTVDPVEG